MDKTMITIFVIGILLISAILYFGLRTSPCIEWSSNGYYAKFPNESNYLSDNLDEARIMFDGLIVAKRECVKRERRTD